MWRWRRLFRSRKPPAGVPEERWIVVADSEGIIFPAGFGCVSYDWELTAHWTPSREIVFAAEDRIAGFLHNYPRHTSGAAEEDWIERLSAPLILAKLGSYQRQYSGIEFEGKRALFINFFPRGSEERWTTEPVEVEDGWYSYFQVIYRPVEADFPWFHVNGDA